MSVVAAKPASTKCPNATSIDEQQNAISKSVSVSTMEIRSDSIDSSDALLRGYPYFFGPFNQAPYYPCPRVCEQSMVPPYLCRFCELWYDSIDDMEFHLGSLDHLRQFYKINSLFVSGVVSAYKSMNLTEEEINIRLQHRIMRLHRVCHMDTRYLYLNDEEAVYIQSLLPEDKYPRTPEEKAAPAKKSSFLYRYRSQIMNVLSDELAIQSSNWVPFNLAIEENPDRAIDRFINPFVRLSHDDAYVVYDDNDSYHSNYDDEAYETDPN